MAHGQNARKFGNSGKEWWGKRPMNYTPVSRSSGMKKQKRLLHKIERVLGKKNINTNDYD